MGYFSKIIKNTVIMFAVGALLALAAPPIATMLGLGTAFLTGVGHSVLWTGAFFGAFGGIHAAVEPIVNGLVGDTPRHSLEEKVVRTSPVAALHLPVIGHAAALGDEAPGQKFQDMVGGRRAADMSFQDKVNVTQAQPHEQSL